jgi:molybdopterin/thiamine biosynthesis adenylyltransferase
MRLTTEQIERYSRQIMVPDLGGKGQIRLREARVLVVGAGGLGSSAAFYLAAAGVGTLGLVDADQVELSNLQRQILHLTPDIGTAKVESAKAKLSQLNPEVKIKVYPVRLESANAEAMVAGYDFIVDGSDNFSTKFLLNDVAVKKQIAFSHAGVVRLQGQVMTVIPGKSACYRCVFREPPPAEEILSCQQAGILGAVAGTIGTIQATEAIKYLTGFEEGLLTDQLLTYDARWTKFHPVQVKKNPACAACGTSQMENITGVTAV